MGLFALWQSVYSFIAQYPHLSSKALKAASMGFSVSLLARHWPDQTCLASADLLHHVSSNHTLAKQRVYGLAKAVFSGTWFTVAIWALKMLAMERADVCCMSSASQAEARAQIRAKQYDIILQEMSFSHGPNWAWSPSLFRHWMDFSPSDLQWLTLPLLFLDCSGESPASKISESAGHFISKQQLTYSRRESGIRLFSGRRGGGQEVIGFPFI